MTVQVPPVSANSGSLKVAIGLPRVAVAVPLLVIVRVIGELLEPTFTEPNDVTLGVICKPGVGGGGLPEALIAPAVQGPVDGRALPFLSTLSAAMPSEVRFAPRLMAGELTLSVPSLFTKLVEVL